MIIVGIIGGAGYTAGELIRLLINHPQVELKFVHSTSNAGNKIYDVHSGLFGETEILFSDNYNFSDIDVLFLCSAHGASKEFLESNSIPEHIKIIDLAQDFRDETNGFIYGLPEINRNKICNANKIANPGCFATAIQLALLPLAANGLLKKDVHVNAITGSTGAGVKPSVTTHFSWRNNNVSVYKAFEHQHLKEITQTLKQLQNGFSEAINFIPVRGDFARGILATSYTKSDLSIDDAKKLYEDFYKNAAFTFVANKNIDLKQVVNTNKCLVYIEKYGDKLLIISAIDNLLKGASGQAIQNMNIMCGLDEKAGLNLKASAF